MRQTNWDMSKEAKETTFQTIIAMYQRRRVRKEVRRRAKGETKVVTVKVLLKVKSRTKRRRKFSNLTLLCGEATKVANLDTLKTRNSTSTAIYVTLYSPLWQLSSKLSWLHVVEPTPWLCLATASCLHSVITALDNLESSQMSFNSHLNLFWSKSWSKIWLTRKRWVKFSVAQIRVLPISKLTQKRKMILYTPGDLTWTTCLGILSMSVMLSQHGSQMKLWSRQNRN